MTVAITLLLLVAIGGAIVVAVSHARLVR